MENDIPRGYYHKLPIFLYDHGPIILDCHPKKIKRGRPYRMENWFFDFTEVEGIIKESWKSVSNGSAMFKLQRKLEKQEGIGKNGV